MKGSALDFVIVVNDNGELKTVTLTELDRMVEAHYIDSASTYPQLDLELMDDILNRILDERASAEEITAAGAD
jgi:hypothetical protein